MMAAIRRWLKSASVRSGLFRYGGTLIATIVTVLVLPLLPPGPIGVLLVFVVLVACSWFGGIGPAMLLPFVMGAAHRAYTEGVGSAIDLSPGGLIITLSFTVFSVALGWSGEMRRRAQAIVRDQALRLKEQDRRKDQFLATLAHELRNPLAPLRSGLEIMRMSAEGRASPEVLRDVQEMMQRQVDHMVRLIDDLLDVSRINTGKIELRRTRVLLADVVRDALDASRPHIDARRHRLTATLPHDPIVLEADRARLSQVLLNLLNNAAKFTPSGGDIFLSIERHGESVEIRVRDTGVGIPSEMLTQVFEMFAQVETSLARSTAGLGIGLSLVKTLVEMHGGSVRARSEGRGRGSEFIVCLPVPVQAESDSSEVPQADADSKPCDRRRVLVVDDNRDAARSLVVLLKNAGHECRTAFDGPTALEMALEFSPDVFVLDIGMPGMSGHELARRVRAIPQLHSALLIAVSGWGQDEDRCRSLEAGFDHHLMKPVVVSALQELMNTRGRRVVESIGSTTTSG